MTKQSTVLINPNISLDEVKKILGEKKGGLIFSSITNNNIGTLQQLSSQGFEIVPIVPNFSQYTRDMTEKGPVGAIIHRFSKLTFKNKIFFCSHYLNPLLVLKVLKKDFSIAIRILTELELLNCANSISFSKFAVGDEICDLALAFSNKQVFIQLNNLADKHKKNIIYRSMNKMILSNFLTVINPQRSFQVE